MPRNWKQVVRGGGGVNALLGVLALAAGAAAVLAAQAYLQREVRRIEAGTEAQYRPVAVVVASRDLEAGETLSPEALAVRRMPSGFLPAGSVHDAAAGEVIGRRLKIPLRRGDALSRVALAPQGTSSLARELPDGFRAITLPVDDITSHAGLVRAGDEVDLYLMQDRGAQGSRLSVLLERVPVIATGESLHDDPVAADGGAYGTITLRTSAADAARVLLAERAGSLAVLLRATGDVTPAQLTVSDTRTLLDPGRSSSRSRPGPAIELLLGGNGGPEPRRLWLRVAGEPT